MTVASFRATRSPRSVHHPAGRNRRPRLYRLPLALLLIECVVIAFVVLWGKPWQLQVGVGLVIFVVALLAGFWIRHVSPTRRTYASENARLAISQQQRGWYVVDHIARPGARGEGHQLRVAVAGELTAAADEQQVIVYAKTTSMKLAHAYMDDIPGLRMAPSRDSKILLVRVPRRRISANVEPRHT